MQRKLDWADEAAKNAVERWTGIWTFEVEVEVEDRVARALRSAYAEGEKAGMARAAFLARRYGKDEYAEVKQACNWVSEIILSEAKKLK
jgi:hypothetical protein